MTDISTSKEALLRAIDVLGGQSALAKAVGKEQGNVYHWLKSGRLPSDYCPLVERATTLAGERVPCEELRPDVAWEILRAVIPRRVVRIARTEQGA